MDVLFNIAYSMVYDVCQAIVAKTNPEGKWIDEYIIDSNEKNDSEYIRALLSKLPKVDERMYLFSNLEVKNSSFLSECYMRFIDEDGRDCTVEGFCEYLRNFDKIKSLMCKYYFGIETEDVKSISKLCYESSMGNNLKALLYEFLIFEDTYMDIIEQEIIHIAFSIQKFYEVRSDEVEKAQKKFNFGMFQKKIAELRKGDQWGKKLERVCVSFSIWNRYLILRKVKGKEGYLIIGTNYEKVLYKVSNEKIDLAVFGNAIGDPVRQKILKTVIENGELSVGEITKNIEGTPTTTLYHLDVLKKANVLKSRSSGRKVICWVNDVQIDLAIKALGLMRKGGEKDV